MNHTSHETITYGTYPDMFTDYENMVENEDYDVQMREITVPTAWAKEWVKDHCDMTLDEYENEYTWDDSIQMYEDAKAEGVLISTEIITV